MKHKPGRWYPVLIVLSVLAALKMIFFAFGLDEEYQLVMAYRNVRGDRLFLDMWEPHQSSAFLCVILMKPWLALFGTTGVVLYLRLCGTLLHLAVSLYLYHVLKDFLEREHAGLLALIYFNTIPKQMILPEFGLMQVWFYTLLALFLARYYTCGRKYRYLVFAALSLVLNVLSYPSCLILFPFLLVLIGRFSGKGKWRDMGIVTLVCGLCGLAYLGMLFTYTSPEALMETLSHILEGDVTHSLTLGGKVLSILKGCLSMGALWVLCLAGAFVLTRRKKAGAGQFWCLTAVFACGMELFCWIVLGYGYERMHIHLVAFSLAGVLASVRRVRTGACESASFSDSGKLLEVGLDADSSTLYETGSNADSSQLFGTGSISDFTQLHKISPNANSSQLPATGPDINSPQPHSATPISDSLQLYETGSNADASQLLAAASMSGFLQMSETDSNSNSLQMSETDSNSDSLQLREIDSSQPSAAAPISGSSQLRGSGTPEQPQRFLYYIMGGALLSLLAVIYLTDLSFAESVPHAMPAAFCGAILLTLVLQKRDNAINRTWIRVTLLIWCLTAIFGKGYTLRSGTGGYCNVLQSAGILRDGPAAGTISNYMFSYVYNCDYEDWQAYMQDGDRVLIMVDQVMNLGTIQYLFKDVEISHFSIVNPTAYDERLLEYWEMYPEKAPNVIIVDCWYGQLMTDPDGWLMHYIEGDFGYSQVTDGRYIRIYRK